jgi:hypothetical protein
MENLITEGKTWFTKIAQFFDESSTGTIITCCILFVAIVLLIFLAHKYISGIVKIISWIYEIRIGTVFLFSLAVIFASMISREMIWNMIDSANIIYHFILLQLKEILNITNKEDT